MACALHSCVCSVSVSVCVCVSVCVSVYVSVCRVQIRCRKFMDKQPNTLQSIRPFLKLDGGQLLVICCIKIQKDGPEVAKTCVCSLY